MSRVLTLAYLPASNNGLSYRGTEVSLLDYMTKAQTLLGHRSILCLDRQAFNEPTVLKLFQARFPIIWFSDPENLERQLLEQRVDALYSIRAGPTTGLSLKRVPLLAHCVYEMEPRGSELMRAGVSPSVAGSGPYVPHMVSLVETNEDYRSLLGIPSGALVFGRHGGADTFDLPFVKSAILQILQERENIYFLFAVRPHMLRDVTHPRLICLEPFADPKVKRKFINTFDAYLHAQSLGETFGLACGEASQANKPVIVWDGGRVREHLRLLGEKCIRYKDESELYHILTTFRPEEAAKKNWVAYEDFKPELVMKQFDAVFLAPLRALLGIPAGPSESPVDAV